MSCTVSHESRVMLAELLADEKEDTRVRLRAEMDRLVDSMFHRLTNKLMMNSHLERYQSGDGGDCAQVGNYDDQLESSTSSHLMPQHQNFHYSHQQPDNPIQFNHSSNQQSELSYFSQPIIPPNAQENFETISNEQFNQNFDDDAGECYCDECLGAIEIDDEVDKDDDDDSDSVQCIEDEQGEHELVQPVKKPRVESTEPNIAQPKMAKLSPIGQLTSKAQPNQINKQYITIHLKCIDSECPDTFTEDQLTQHMFDVHLIGPNRCLAKDCGQSFNNHCILGEHIKQSHQHTTQWHCGKCSKHYSKYSQLYIHNINQHQLGHFQCSFPSCTFTGEYRGQVYNHYSKQHRSDYICSQADCNYRTYQEVALKTHERAHLGIKPYRCKWFNCDYTSSYRNATLRHIQTHLARLEDPNHDLANSSNPKEYLEVTSELL